CPDPVDKYLEESSKGSVQSRSPSGQRKAGESAPSPQPLICCPPAGPQVGASQVGPSQVGPSVSKPARTSPTHKRKRSQSVADCKEKQTC
ncbi:hypothetical protein NL108_003607, partial [Boleophthalmus pectinirostris]